MASPQSLRCTLLYGGRSLRPEYTALKTGAHIIIGTPGRTLDHIRQGTLDLQSVRFFVLDEADEMLDRGFAHDVEAIFSRTPSSRQTALFVGDDARLGGENSHKVHAGPRNGGDGRRPESAAHCEASGLYH